MKLSIIVVVFSSILISCDAETVPSKKSNSDKVTNVKKRVDTNAIVNPILEVDTARNKTIPDPPFVYSYLMEEEVDLLEEFLLESNTQSLDVTLVALAEAKSDTSVIQNFLNLIKITDLFKDSILHSLDYMDPMTAEEKFISLPDAILGFKNSCIAECTEYDCSFEMEKFYALADKTVGTLDNEFFELIEIMDGKRYTSSPNFKNWFAQVWDYGGASLLGDSRHYEFINKSKALKSRTTLVNHFLDRYLNECAIDILYGVYMYSPEKVVTEIDMILSLKAINSELEDKIMVLKTTILSGDYTWENSIDGKLQFNCATGNCNFGG